MTLNVLEIEELLKQEALLEIAILHDQEPLSFQSFKNEWRALKKDFLNKGHEAEFYKLLSSFSPKQFKEEDLAKAKALVEEKRLEIKEINDQIKDIQQQSKNSLEFLFELLNGIQQKKQELLLNIEQARQAEEDYNALIQTRIPVVEETAEDKQEKELLQALQAKLQDRLSVLQEHKDNFSQVSELTNEKQIALKESLEREGEALRISKLKDPQVEELGHWFENCNSLLEDLNGIKSFKCVSAESMEIEFKGELEIVAQFTVNDDKIDLKLNREINTFQLLQEADRITDVSKRLVFLIANLTNRVLQYQSRWPEMMQICQVYGSIYDESLGELLIQSDKSQRAFVLKIDAIYPLNGLDGFKIVGIEPLEPNESLIEWNKRLRLTNAERVEDIVHLLI